MQNNNIGEIISSETKNRLEIMQREDYEWPPKAGIKDYIGIVAIVSIAGLLILGCMMGVII